MKLEFIKEKGFDLETLRVLEISLYFLNTYFGHNIDKGSELMKSFFDNRSNRYDEDLIHHESSYRVSAAIHYYEFLKGENSGFGEWMRTNGHFKPPREAFEYFRENYFDIYRDNPLKKWPFKY